MANHDVTDRIEAQRENAESQRMFEALFDNSDAAIIDHDFSKLFLAVQALKRLGVKDLRKYVAESDERLAQLEDVVQINDANDAAYKMLGVSTLQELGKRSTNILDIADAMCTGATSIRRSEYIAAGANQIPVVYTLRIPRSEEEARRVPIVIMDLSDIKLAEAARQATIAKSKFLSSMSHEIRTPLNGVIGNLELLGLTALDDGQVELISDADKAAKALLALIGNILDFSKIEAGKLSIEVNEINPAGLMEEAVDILQSRARLKNIFITSVVGPDVPTLIRGDANRIRQILLNLIGNAVKFTEDGGVQVSLRATEFRGQTCELLFEIHDSGRGINRAQEAQVFEPFGQIDRVRDVESTGLGLSISKSLVEAFGGTIGCEGVPDEGSTFWFTIPAKIARAAPAYAPPDLSNVKAMVVGCGDAASKSLEEYFKSRGAILIAGTMDATTDFAEEPDAKASTADIAMIVLDGDDGDPGLAQRLKQKGIVPLFYGSEGTPHIRLRQGYAAVIPHDADARYLDRNFRLLTGHAQARERLVANHTIYASELGSMLVGKRVLVLEDRLVNQVVIQRQLAKLGIEFALAADGVNGLRLSKRQQFDLILCDCSMPVMNGYDFTRALREREKTEGKGDHIPIIALTANAFREDADKCLECGMDDFISKPVTIDRLTALLVRWLVSSEPDEVFASQPDGESSAPRLIEMSALAEILGTDDSVILNEVLTEFLAVADVSLKEVRAAVSIGEPGGIKAAAHSAKGEARSAAATRLSDLYAELELAAKDEDWVVADELVIRAAVELRHVENFIRERLAAAQ